jgi:hypothetical protein
MKAPPLRLRTAPKDLLPRLAGLARLAHSAKMGPVMRIVRAAALGCALAACGQVTGLGGYSAGEPPADDGALPVDDAGVVTMDSGDAPAGSDTTQADASQADATQADDTGSVGSDATDEDGAAGCSTGFIACAGGCVDPSSPLNCGGCGNTCSGNTALCASADGGPYACAASCPPTASTLCGATCVDTTSSVNDCDACGNACSTSVVNAQAVCVNGQCGFDCVTGTTLCSGACVRLTTANNCGSCGNQCSGAAAVCAGSGGAYACASGCPATAPLLCGSTCVDKQSDVGNCGGCGSACASGQTCASGHCFGCGTNCPVSVSVYSCVKGGCNAAGGACTGAGPCYCTNDNQCSSGKCLKVTGHNDVSCGASCTGAGAADGFDCTLAAPGIPAACAAPAFGYTPSNFAPAGHAPASTSTTIDCNTTYNSGTHAFTGWCAGQTAPTIYSNVAQTGGPNVDILAFRGLTLSAGNTLTLTSSGGGNAVILAVYGDASIQGTIHADGAAGATNTGTAGASGPGGNHSCGASAGTSQGNDGHTSAGAGGGASGAGGTGPGGVGGSTAAGGAARANASLVPLYGGCPGGASGSWACTTSGGGGGGAVQISAAGALTVTGSITALGGAGGTSTCTSGGCAPGPNHTYGGGGGGGGSGGAILLEGSPVSAPLGSTVVNGAAGGSPPTSLQELGVPGAGGTSASPAGAAGTGSIGSGCGSDNENGAGGGGGYGYLKINTGAAPTYSCTTALAPTPVCSSGQTACLCVADSDCPSGECSNANGQCTGTCTGATTAGTYDSADCALAASVPSSWSCAAGTCDDVTSPGGVCRGSGVSCWCTSDSECTGGLCVSWAGCAAGACTGSGTPDGFHCAP